MYRGGFFFPRGNGILFGLWGFIELECWFVNFTRELKAIFVKIKFVDEDLHKELEELM